MKRQKWSVVSGQWSVNGRTKPRQARARRDYFSLTTDHRPPTTARPGITLMEVLISIGIMAIGLVSVASLLPMGGLQAQKANVEERKAELVLNASRDFHIRGMANPQTWIRPATTGTNFAPYLPININTATDLPYIPPVAIDPLMVGAAGTNSSAVAGFPLNAVSGIPSGVAAPPQMARLSVVSAATILQAATATTPATYAPNRMLAENIFTSFDDVVVNQPDDRSLPATGAVMIDPQSQKPLRRDYDGEFSWLATIAPRELDPNQALPAVSNNYTLSIVVFDRRLVPRPLNSNTISLVGEATVLVDLGSMGSGIGGGDMNLRSDSSDLLDNLVRPNQWIMLTRREGQWTSSSGSQAPPAKFWPAFKWYRVLSAAPTEPVTSAMGGAGKFQRSVTLAGPDWQPNVKGDASASGSGNTQTYACLFDGAVAVIQRTIQLEGPSIWNQ
jgi:type II secretory pathway pseudopilin PulG